MSFAQEVIKFLQDKSAMTLLEKFYRPTRCPEDTQDVVDKNRENICSFMGNASTGEISCDVATFIWNCIVFVPVMTRQVTNGQPHLWPLWFPALRIPRDEDADEDDDDDDEAYVVHVIYAAVARYLPRDTDLNPPVGNKVHYFIYPEDMVGCCTEWPVMRAEDPIPRDPVMHSIWGIEEGTLMYSPTEEDWNEIWISPPDEGRTWGDGPEMWEIHGKAVGFDYSNVTARGFPRVDWAKKITHFWKYDNARDPTKNLKEA